MEINMGQPASTNSIGMGVANVPDVCKTPTPTGPVPIPYPNIAQNAMFIPSTIAKKVKIVGASAVIVGAKTGLSNGDEPGVLGGVSSGSFIGEMECTKGSSKVRIEGKGAVRMGDSTKQNKGNTMGMIAVPSQPIVMIG